MPQRPILDYQTARRVPAQRPLYLPYVFGGANALMGACIVLCAMDGMRYGRLVAALATASMGVPVAAAGVAELLHERVKWRVLVGLQSAALLLPLAPAALLASDCLAPEFGQGLEVVTSVLLLCWLVPMGYLFLPGVRRRLERPRW